MNKRKKSLCTNVFATESSFNIKKIRTDGFINYITVPSLENSALANIIVNLWSHTDSVEKIFMDSVLKSSFCKYPEKKKFNELSKIVSEELSLLPLPKVLKCKAEYIIKSIGLEIVQWMADFEYFFELQVSKIEHFRSICWTMKGTIDKVKSLELHLANENPLHNFYKACEYCLEDLIAVLWRQIPRRTQENDIYFGHVYHDYSHHLVAYWASVCRNELYKLLNIIKSNDSKNIYIYRHSIWSNMLTLSVFQGKMLAVKYFWKKLTDEERNNNKVRWTCLAIEWKGNNPHKNEYADIIFFLLSQLDDEEQQREVFQKHSDIILNCLFFCWPWQTFLLPTLELMWDYIDSKVYVELLHEAIYRIEENELIEMVFKDVWLKSPMNFKKDFIQNIIRRKGSEVLQLLEIGDTEIIKLIFNDANVEERKNILFSTVGSRKLFNLMYNDKLYLLVILMEESMMSECEMKNVKENILRTHGEELCYYCIYNDNWQIVKKILDWCFNCQDQIAIFKAKILNTIKGDNSLGILGAGKWSSFESFVNWLFNSNEEINQFKSDISIHHKMKHFICDIIVRVCNFEFADKLLVWYFPSVTEIEQFKNELMVSDVGLDMFKKVNNDCDYDSEEMDNNYGYWSLVDVEVCHYKYNSSAFVKRLVEWFCPFKREVLTEFKEKYTEKFAKKSFTYRFSNKFDIDVTDLYSVLDSFVHD